MSDAHLSDYEDSHPKRKPKFKVLNGGPKEGQRDLPHSLEAEEYLLSCILLDGREVMARCMAVRMRAEWFYDTKHGTIFEALRELYERNEPMDISVVAEHLKERRKLDEVGGYAFLAQVSSRIPTTAQAGYFIEKVKELACARAVIREGTKLVEGTYALHGGAEQLTSSLELHQSWVAATLDLLRSGLVTMEMAAKAAYQRTLDKLAGKPDTSRWLYTGLREYDEKFGPLDANNEDWLVIVGAFQGGAKSSFSRQVLLTNLRAGKTAQVFLLETGVGKLLESLACTAAEVRHDSLDRLPKDMADRYRRALDEMHGYLGKTLFVCDEVIPAEALVARVDDHARKHGAPADVIMVDHIHLLNALRPFSKREAEMGFIAKLLARCGKRHNRTVMGLAQLNRSARAEGKNIRPEPHHIRDSGEIEQAARRIILLHTPDKDMRGADQTKNQDQVMMEIHNAKHNNGSVGWREVWFRRSITRFFDLGRGDHHARSPSMPDGRPAPGGASKRAFKEGQQ